jgi:hypothetical protein
MNLNRRNFLLASGALALAGCETSSSVPTASSGSIATFPSAFPLIADTATRLDAAKARALRTQGVRTVFRYYSHLPPSLPGKDLQPEEARIILDEGLSIGSVFQHFNNCYSTFENRWGREDAEQALRMAQAAGQPQGSAIYFGVDADWPYQAMRDPILAYFDDVKRVFEGSGISVGVYSNGCICNAIHQRGLAEYFWLSGSTGHSGTQAFYNSNRWTLFQNALDIVPAPVGFGIDTNIANPATQGNFGQWRDRGSWLAAHAAADTNAALANRRFLTANVDLKATTDAASATLTSLRKDQNVRVLETMGEITRVLTQEGGAKGSVMAAEGYLATAVLAPMDRFLGNSGDYGLCGSPIVPNETAKYQNCERATSRIR